MDVPFFPSLCPTYCDSMTWLVGVLVLLIVVSLLVPIFVRNERKWDWLYCSISTSSSQFKPTSSSCAYGTCNDLLNEERARLFHERLIFSFKKPHADKFLCDVSWFLGYNVSFVCCLRYRSHADVISLHWYVILGYVSTLQPLFP